MRRHALIATFFGLLCVAVACGDGDDDNPTPPDVTSGGSNSKAGTGSDAGSPSTGSGATHNEGGATGKAGDSSDPDGGQGGAAPLPEPECDLPELGQDGCFNCPKQGAVEQWLNRCSDSECEPFDNEARLPLLNADGSLPDLPN